MHTASLQFNFPVCKRTLFLFFGLMGLAPQPAEAIGHTTSNTLRQTTDTTAIPIPSYDTLTPFTSSTPFTPFPGDSAQPTHVRVIVEISAGSNEKWEVDSETGILDWDYKDGKPRVIQYLPYPWNYGMIPGTILPLEQGGDGDPLDVILLGQRAERGAIVEGRVIGMVRMTDRGEQDDKLLAVRPDGIFSAIHGVSELEEQFPGVLEITSIWLRHYKGPDSDVQILGLMGQAEALEQVYQAAQDSF
jgi:inorganic pyrophosphatase